MVIISFNGIERIGKSYYCGILSKYLTDKFDTHKFSFPSYTTINGKKLETLINQFKNDDLLSLTNHSHNRYKKIAYYLIKNYDDYKLFIEGFLSRRGTVALINNNFFSIIAHGLATDVMYNDIKNMINGLYLTKTKTLAFFLVVNDVKKTLIEYFDFSDGNTLSDDFINYYTHVNRYYKQIYLTYLKDENITPILIQVDTSNPKYVTETCNLIKRHVDRHL